jgi:hypothetical protein
MPTLNELETRIAALETAKTDDSLRRAVLTLLRTAREMSTTLRRTAETMAEHDRRLETLESKVDETNQRVRSLEKSTADTKDLLLRAVRHGQLAH